LLQLLLAARDPLRKAGVVDVMFLRRGAHAFARLLFFLDVVAIISFSTETLASK
jgi:hypothetical protein